MWDFLKIAVIVLGATFCSGFALLADGLAGGKASSLIELKNDVLLMRSDIILRLLFWFLLLGPATLAFLAVRKIIRE